MRQHARQVRLAITQRVLSPFRLPIFTRLCQQSGFDIRLLYGAGIRGTKLKNAVPVPDLDRRQLWTLSLRLRSSGRRVPLVLHPGLFFQLVRFRPDMILCEGSSNILNNLAVVVYAHLFRSKVVWWSLGELPGRHYRGLSKVYRTVARALERRADGWLAYSTQAAEYFKRQGYPADRVFTAINTIDTDIAFERIRAGASSVEPLRRRLGLTQRWVVSFVGALEPAKRVDRLIRAFAQLHDEKPEAALLIIGDGSEFAALRQLAANLGVKDDVIFTGEIREDVAAYFALGDAFVLPGLGGLAIPEAMAHGLPVICTQADGTEKDFIRPGVTGVILEEAHDDVFVRRLAETLVDWSQDPERLKQMGAQARMLIEEKLNIHSYLAAVQCCLRTVAGGSHGAFA